MGWLPGTFQFTLLRGTGLGHSLRVGLPAESHSNPKRQTAVCPGTGFTNTRRINNQLVWQSRLRQLFRCTLRQAFAARAYRSRPIIGCPGVIIPLPSLLAFRIEFASIGAGRPTAGAAVSYGQAKRRKKADIRTPAAQLISRVATYSNE